MNHFFSQPTSLLAMGYVSAGTPGTLIRAPKQQYLPSEQTHFLVLLCERVQLGPWGLPSEPPNKNIYPKKKAGFPWPLSKRGKTSNSLSKLPNEYLFSQPTSLLARGHVLASWDPWDSHQIPRSTFNTIHPRNKPIFLGRFQRGERPLILSQNSQMNHFFLSPPHSW